MSTAQTVNVHCAVPENIHTAPTGEIGISWGLGGGGWGVVGFGMNKLFSGTTHFT